MVGRRTNMVCRIGFVFILLVQGFLNGLNQACADPTPIGIVEAQAAPDYVRSLFRTRAMHKLASTPGNPVFETVQALSQKPLFTFVPNDHPAGRLNFTAWAGLLALRHDQYKNPYLADLYLLHEIRHIVTLGYDPDSDFATWKTRLLLNEKETSLFTETEIHFLSNEFRLGMNIPEIYADRYLKSGAPYPDRGTLLASFRGIGGRSFDAVDAQERRSWVYDRSNEVWSHVYWPVAHAIEKRVTELLEQHKVDPKAAAESYVQWLQGNMTDGLLFANQAIEFRNYYVKLEHLYENPAWYEDVPVGTDEVAAHIARLSDSGELERTAMLDASVRLLKRGLSSIVYSLVFPETIHVTGRIFRETEPREIYGKAYTRKQDLEHKPFLAAYRQWAAPVVKGLDGFANAYPSNGSSEAIKDTLAWLSRETPQAKLHVFEGEYEGATAYADGLHIPVVKHARTPETLARLKELVQPGDLFYISQPSALDGNVWAQYDEFMQASVEAGLKVLVDLAYVGAVAKNFEVKVDYPNVEAVFFSLSKSFGTYYQRIGGVFTRRQHPLLFGNKWFKNALSLRVGTELLKKYSVYHLPRAYLWAQTAAAQRASDQLGFTVKPSDAVILAHAEMPKADPRAQGDHAILYRGGEQGYFRVCLTPVMDMMIQKADHSSEDCEEALSKKPHDASDVES